MHYSCPHCRRPIPASQVWLRAVHTCEHCGGASAMGRLWTWTVAALLGFSSSMATVVLTDPGRPLYAAILGFLPGFLLGVFTLVRPVPYQRWLSRRMP